MMIYRCCSDRDNKTPDGIFPVHPSPLPEQSPYREPALLSAHRDSHRYLSRFSVSELSFPALKAFSQYPAFLYKYEIQHFSKIYAFLHLLFFVRNQLCILCLSAIPVYRLFQLIGQFHLPDLPTYRLFQLTDASVGRKNNAYWKAFTFCCLFHSLSHFQSQEKAKKVLRLTSTQSLYMIASLFSIVTFAFSLFTAALPDFLVSAHSTGLPARAFRSLPAFLLLPL